MKNVFKILIHSIVIASLLAGCNTTPAVNNLIKSDGFNISFLDEIYKNCQLFPDKTEFSTIQQNTMEFLEPMTHFAINVMKSPYLKSVRFQKSLHQLYLHNK